LLSPYRHRLVAEALGTAALLAMVVGSGIAGERLSGGNLAVSLLVNAVATAAGLSVLVLGLGPISGAHFNPAVTISQAALGKAAWRDVPGYLLAQFFGGAGGVFIAHAMFALPLVMSPTHARAGAPLLFSEAVATAGLVLTIALVSRARPSATPWAVGLFILSAYFFTASTSFANPAVTVARALTDTFSGIRPADVPGFIVAQSIGAAGATLLLKWLEPSPQAEVTT
jgi:glycerol uptake facilitator-like aquaporin